MLAAIIRPGFVRSRAGVVAIFVTLAVAVAGLFTDYWQIAAVPLVAVGIYTLLSGDEHLPHAEGDQRKPDHVQDEA